MRVVPGQLPLGGPELDDCIAIGTPRRFPVAQSLLDLPEQVVPDRQTRLEEQRLAQLGVSVVDLSGLHRGDAAKKPGLDAQRLARQGLGEGTLRFAGATHQGKDVSQREKSREIVWILGGELADRAQGLVEMPFLDQAHPLVQTLEGRGATCRGSPLDRRNPSARTRGRARPGRDRSPGARFPMRRGSTFSWPIVARPMLLALARFARAPIDERSLEVDHLELVVDAKQALGITQQQIAVRANCFQKAAQQCPNRRQVEIDDHIAAEDEIDRLGPQARKGRRRQILSLEANEGVKRAIDLVVVAPWMEKTASPPLGHPLHPPLRETPRLCRLDRGRVEVGGPYLGLFRARAGFSENDGQAVRLLSGGAPSGPDRQRISGLTRPGEQIGDDPLRKRAKLARVAEEVGLAYRHQRQERAKLPPSGETAEAVD